MTKITKVLASALALAGATSALPAAASATTSSDGFPTPNAQQLKSISVQAAGSLSNAPPPGKLADSTLQSFQVIALNEQFEVAFFQSLLANVTGDVGGFRSWHNYHKSDLEKILKTVVAQEELHAINAVGVLNKFKKLAPLPCKYHFPTTNIRDAIGLASAFTSLVVGALQDVSQAAAVSGDNGVVRAVASVIGQEGEQNGLYRLLLGSIPAEKPFLTTAVGPYVFSYVVNNFIVPGSCPFDLNALGVPLFPSLVVRNAIRGFEVKPQDQNLQFTADLSTATEAKKYQGGNGNGLFITYFSGQLLPISVPVEKVQWDGSKITFEASFPFEENIMFGASFAALTVGNNFTNPDAVPAATLAAPAIIQVNDYI